MLTLPACLRPWTQDIGMDEVVEDTAETERRVVRLGCLPDCCTQRIPSHAAQV